MSKPQRTGTSHLLPFNLLSPSDFERLCYWLVARSADYERAEHLGAAGKEQGRDIVALQNGVLCAFQCKRVKNFGANSARSEIRKLARLESPARPHRIVFLVSCNVSDQTRREGEAAARDHGIACEFLGLSELDHWVKQHPELLAEFFQVHPSGEVPASGAFHAVVEIVEDWTSSVMDTILKDLEEVVLARNPFARVLTRSDSDDVSGAGEPFSVPNEIVRAIRETLSQSRRTARHVFEWSSELDSGVQLTISFTTLGDSLLLHQVYTAPDVFTEDLAKSDSPDVLKRSGTFTPFPSLHGDILTNLNLHSGGGLLPPLHIYGYRKATIPAEFLGSSRLLALLVEKFAGASRPLAISEVATTGGRAVLALDNSFGLLYRLWLLPIGSFEPLLPLLDFVALFFHDHHGARGLPSEQALLVVRNLERIARVIGSVPLAGGGLFESMIADLQHRASIGDKRGDSPRASRTPLPSGTVDDFAERIRLEFEAMTEVDLEPIEVKTEQGSNFTRLILAMKFAPDANPKASGPRTGDFESLMQQLGASVARSEAKSSGAVHSVRYRPFMLTDAVVFVVKVNWCSHDKEDVVGVFEI